MPWIPIDRLPEEAKDGREVDLWLNGIRYPQCHFLSGAGFWLHPSGRMMTPTHFYDFGNGRTMPDAPEGE